MEWERGARRVKFGRLTRTHSVSMLCWSWRSQGQGEARKQGEKEPG